MTVLAAATAEPNAGWGKLLALVIAAGVFWIGKTIYERWMSVPGDPHSPTDGAVALEGVKPQVTDPADPVLTPSGEVAKRGEPDLDVFVKRQVGRARPSQIIRAAKAKFGASESTIKRAMRKAKEPKS